MRRRLAALTIAGSLLLAACGNEKQSSAADSSVKRYCDVTRSIFRGQEQPPTDEEMDRWESAAPAEIAADVKMAAGAYRDLNNTAQPDFALLEREPLAGAFDRVEGFNEDKCGIKAE